MLHRITFAPAPKVLSEIEAKQPDRIVACQSLALVIWQPFKMTLDDLPRIWKSHIKVRIVIGPHAVFLTPPGESASSHIIFKESAEDVLLNNFTGLARDRKSFLEVALEIIIPLLQEEWNPADLTFGKQQPELRMAFKGAGENKIE